MKFLVYLIQFTSENHKNLCLRNSFLLMELFLFLYQNL